MTVVIIYSLSIVIITNIIFKLEINKIKEFQSNNTYFFSQFCQHTVPSGSYCIERLKLPHHSLNELEKISPN